jgi:protease-4
LSHFKTGGVLTPGEKCNDTFLYDLKSKTLIAERIYQAKGDDSGNKFVSVTKIDGVITKNGGESSFGTIQMANRFKQFDKLSNIIGHIVLVDSGGGASNAVKYMRNVMLESKKPVVGFGRDLVGSAGYYIISAADHIIVNDKDALVGSIGTMVELQSFKKVDENKQTGERVVRIYADQSTEKNVEFEEAINNLNFKPIKENVLNPNNQKFIDDVRLSRPNVTESQLKGGISTAAKSVGTLIDSIGTFEDAVKKVEELSKISKSKPNSGAIINQKQKVMTRDELKAQHPEVFNSIVTEGINAERSRVNAILKFAHLDLESCTKMVSDGKNLDQEFMAEMTLKAISANQLKARKEESDGPIDPIKETTPENKGEIEERNYLNEVRAEAGLKPLEEVK